MRLVLFVLKHLWLRLWQCRLSVISVLIGYFAMSFAAIKDLFLEPRDTRAAVAFALIVLLFWVIPVHRSARAAITSTAVVKTGWRTLAPQLTGICRFIDAWMPRVLGFLPFVILLAAMPNLAESLRGLSVLPEYAGMVSGLWGMAACLFVAAALYAGYVYFRRSLRDRGRITDKIWSLDLRNRWSVLAFLHTVLTVGVFLWAVIAPLSFTNTIGRSSLLPVLLGGPLPFLTPVAGWANQVRAPLILVAVLVFVGLSAINQRFHDVRTYQSPHWAAAQVDTGSPARLTDISTAITDWMAANDCTANPQICPEPVLIAASGGGTRSAFFTASVLGALLDLTRGNPADYDDLGKTIFAMSGASGGSVGITLTKAALADAAANPAPPCQHIATTWFGALPDYAGPNRDVQKSWRACLQALAAGDLLSAPIAGLAYRDYMALPIPLPRELGFGADRNTLIEQALERHYKLVVFNDPSICKDDEDRGLCRALGYRAAITTPAWLPLLILGSTSVDHATLVVSSDLNTAYGPGGGVEPDPVPTAHGVFEILAAKPSRMVDPAPAPGIETALDLRLSTAALMSARFPFVLTAGNLRNSDGEVVERVVDGGYFDDSGLGVLGPIRRALEQRGLRPIVVLIDNAPLDIDSQESPEVHAGKYLRLAGRSAGLYSSNEVRRFEVPPMEQYLAILLEPIGTLNNIRGARAREAERGVGGELPPSAVPRFFPIRLTQRPDFASAGSTDPWCLDRPKGALNFANLVVSWWLSPVAQRFVDAQLCGVGNRWQLEQLADALRRGPRLTDSDISSARTYSDAR